MEFLEPELQKSYEKCKYIVKLWEHRFKKKYNRVPSKLDIKEASTDVRNAYRKYYQLKTAILEESFRGVEGFEDIDDEEENGNEQNVCQISESQIPHESNSTVELVTTTTKDLPTAIIPEENSYEKIEDFKTVWGTHLNNQQDEAIPQNTEPKPKPNSNISKKLFCGSKFAKRNPRKSLSTSQKTKTDSNSKISLSQPCPSFSSFTSEEAINFLQNDFLDKPFKEVTHFEGSLSQPVNVVQTFFETTCPRILKPVDAGWLNRIAGMTATFSQDLDIVSSQSIQESAQTETTDYDYDSEDVIENSDEEDYFKGSQHLQVTKKRKIENSDPLSNKAISTSTIVNAGINKAMTNLQQTDRSDVEESCISLNLNECKRKVDGDVECANKGEVELSKIEKECLNEDKLIEKKLSPDSCSPKPYENIITESKDTPPKRSPRKNTKNVEAVEIRTPEAKTSKSKLLKRNGTRKKKTTETKTPQKNIQSASQVTQRRSSRKTRVKVNLQEFSSGEEDAFHTDTDDKDPIFSPENDKKKVDNFISDEESTPNKSTGSSKMRKSNLTSTAKKRDKKNQQDTKNEDENGTYDLEFSIKPRIVASRYGSIKNVLAENKSKKKANKIPVDSKSSEEKGLSEIKDKTQQAKDRLLQKISSGSLNDNFVRIDIKKKVFVRGKSGKNFSKYKKAQWKKAKALSGPDMDMGGCDGGKLTCFNCGQEGHFARYCKSSKGDALLSINATEETEDDCPFPTLEEASEMAQKANLNVRKPNTTIKDIQISQADEENNEDDNDLFNDEIDSNELLLETLKLEEYVKKLDVQAYMDNVKVVEPYYKLNEDKHVIDTPPEVYEALNRFGHSSFRPGQEQAIMRILSGKSTLVTLSTGSGKSLCYQLPAYLYSQREPCISLIISPLVSLMDDQIMGIAKFLKAACLHSNQTPTQRKKILDAIALGELSILLVSPEAVVAGEKQRGFSSFLRKLPPIAFACIDEAHCVSQWSHNFRPSYLMICRVLRESLGVKTILGLTATATKATQTSIIEHLQIPDGENGVISDIPLPDNLQLSVSKDPNRDFALLSLLLSDRFKDCNSIIIYCTRRQECERIAGYLRTSLKSEQPEQETNKKRKRMSLQAEPYHAGLSASRRRTIQNTFMSGQLRIVVATVAFGMGINKSDIRAVIHYNMPSSFESYVQEVGRAGRDGLKAQCHAFLDSKGGDENELRRHIHSNSIDRHVIRKLLEKIFIPCSCKGLCPKHEVGFSVEATVRALDIPEENISTLLCYLELHENKYIELLSPAYTKCKVISYSGPLQIRKVAKECPPLAMALALHKNKVGDDANILEFPVIDVAAAMGWESGICKHKLKNLEWTSVNNQPTKSTIKVEFFDLGFRFLAPGNLSGDNLDEALDSLYNRVVEQEKTALLQLNAIHQTLCNVAKPSFKTCFSEESGQLIKSKVREYFNSPDPLKLVPKIEYPKYNEEQLIADVKALICTYRDNNFTGRAIARIFQGIQSPNYPAVIWGRCKFWRSHLDKDFQAIVKTATKEIIRLR